MLPPQSVSVAQGTQVWAGPQMGVVPEQSELPRQATQVLAAALQSGVGAVHVALVTQATQVPDGEHTDIGAAHTTWAAPTGALGQLP